MRCLIVQGGFGAGGTEKVVALLARHRLALGDEVHVAGLTRPVEGSYFDYPPGVTLHVERPDGEGSGKGAQRLRFRQIRRLIGEVQPDVIISFLTKVNTLAVLASFGTGIPVIISERNNPNAQPSSRIWSPLNRFAIRAAARIVMQTQRLCDELPGAAQKKAIVIPNPCNPIGLPGNEPEHGDGVHFVAVGRLDKQKGFDLLLRAFQICLRSEPTVKLTIFGEGAERAALEQLSSALSISSAVRLPGVTERPGEWIAAGNTLVLSSRYEGFPNVVAEATVCGLPVIAFDCPYGPRELIKEGQNGLLVQEGDVDGLAKAMSKLAADPGLRALMREAAPLNRARLSEDAVMQLWDHAIESTVEKRSRVAMTAG